MADNPVHARGEETSNQFTIPAIRRETGIMTNRPGVKKKYLDFSDGSAYIGWKSGQGSIETSGDFARASEV